MEGRTKFVHMCTPTASEIIALDDEGQLWRRDADPNRVGPRGGALYRWTRVPGPQVEHDPELETQVEAFRAALYAAKGASR